MPERTELVSKKPTPQEQAQTRRAIFELASAFDIIQNPKSPYEIRQACMKILRHMPVFVVRIDTGWGVQVNRKPPDIPEEHQESWNLTQVNNFIADLASAYGLLWKRKPPPP